MRERNNITKQRISQALGERRTRMAVLIVESIVCGISLIDEQSPAVVEALLEHGRKRALEDKGSRRDIDLALIKYCEEALEKAKQREHQLYYGITTEDRTPPR